eukprot:4741832-Pyramimonas_sp.AAC.1
MSTIADALQKAERPRLQLHLCSAPETGPSGSPALEYQGATLSGNAFRRIHRLRHEAVDQK